jgi:uncharacterized membrane protein
VNLVYAILESPHRWSILAGLSFAAACVGAIAMLAWGWSHTLELLWFYAGFFCSLFFATRGFLEWKDRASAALEQASGTRRRRQETQARPVGRAARKPRP